MDPEKRFTINEFLAHPWIRNAQEPTYAAHDAPPLATPARERNRQLGSDGSLRAFNPDLLESPGKGRMDFRSPGAVNLREIFDVSYAVHRQEEEGKRRKNIKQGYNALNTMDEDEYEDDEGDQRGSKAADVHGVEQSLRKANLNAAANARQAAAPRQQQPTQQKGYGQHSPAVTAAAKEVRSKKGAFELNLDGATLLNLRKNKGASNLREVQTAAE